MFKQGLADLFFNGMGKSFGLSCILVGFLPISMSFAQTRLFPAETLVDFQSEIQPILRERCCSCHGAIKQEAGLRLDAGSLILKGNDPAIVVAGKSQKSLLIERIRAEDEDVRMPPEGARLTADQIALFERWIDQGCTIPKDEIVARTPSEHWAFQPIRRPPIPEVENPTWCKNPIDSFVIKEWERQGIQPLQPAPSSTLLRRVCLDLLGIPPSIEEQQAFSMGGRIEEVIDDLLSRPGYGERWGRHWLDVARYADSNGYERDAEKPYVWRYRDYVIAAFDEDLPFHRFAIQQIAGDELTDQSVRSTIATGFLRLGHWDDEPADPETDRFDQLDDVLSTIGQAFLGLTIGCARCHDHKFEPLTSRDYYGMIAILNPLERPRKGRTELTLPYDGLDIYRWGETKEAIPETHLLQRGSPKRKGPRVDPSVPAILVSEQPLFPTPEPGSSKRRLGLAAWMTHPDNPLTARVIVNRIWQHHFGQGIVATSNDFGLMGSPPSNPELLDWLADWFVHDADWSIKRLHALILSSQSWQTEKSPRSVVRYRRLEAESIRDSILAVSGGLNRMRFGPAMKPTIPIAILEANTDQEKVWKASSEEEASRRSIYAYVKRGLMLPMFETFDFADTVCSCGQRPITTIAPQALHLFNSEFSWKESQRLASRIEWEVGNDRDRQIHHLWMLALCRKPTGREELAMRDFLEKEGLEQLCRVVLNLNEFVYPE